MPAVGGSIQEISIRGRIFPVAADADNNRKIGGFENENSSNGDGSARLIKTRVPWILGVLTVEVNDDRDDHKFLQDIADANTYEVITITYVSGATWQGDGTITDSLEFSSQNSTAELTLGGPDKLTKQ